MEILTVRPTEKTAVALGFFDGLHLGHRAVIGRVIGRDGFAPSVFTFDSNSVLPKFGTPQMLFSWEVKLSILEEMGVRYVYAPSFSEVKELSGDEFVEQILIGKFNAGMVSCGYDFHFGKGGKCGADELIRLCAEHGIEVEVVPPQKYGDRIISSTEIRDLLKSGQVKLANKLLGSPISYIAVVEHGHEIGRTLNFPTINQHFPENMLIPAEGVYKSSVFIDGKEYCGATSIGVRPTFDKEPKPLMETYIIGFDGNLYGKKIKLSLLDYIRGQKKFSSPDELIKQMKHDVKYIRGE